MHFTLCTSLYALHTMHLTLCTSHYALHSMHFTLRASLYALHSMHLTQCTSLYVLHSMLLGQRAPHGRTLRDAFGNKKAECRTGRIEGTAAFLGSGNLVSTTGMCCADPLHTKMVAGGGGEGTVATCSTLPSSSCAFCCARANKKTIKSPATCLNSKVPRRQVIIESGLIVQEEAHHQQAVHAVHAEGWGFEHAHAVLSPLDTASFLGRGRGIAACSALSATKKVPLLQDHGRELQCLLPTCSRELCHRGINPPTIHELHSGCPSFPLQEQAKNLHNGQHAGCRGGLTHAHSNQASLSPTNYSNNSMSPVENMQHLGNCVPL